MRCGDARYRGHSHVFLMSGAGSACRVETVNLVHHRRDLHHIAAPVVIGAVEPDHDWLFSTHFEVHITVGAQILSMDNLARPGTAFGHNGQVLATDTHGMGTYLLGTFAADEVHLG